MKPIAIVSALHDELSKVLELMPDEHKQTHAGRTFWLGHLLSDCRDFDHIQVCTVGHLSEKRGPWLNNGQLHCFMVKE